MFQCTILIFWYDDSTYQSAHPHLIVLGRLGRVTHSVTDHTSSASTANPAGAAPPAPDAAPARAPASEALLQAVSQELRDVLPEGYVLRTGQAHHLAALGRDEDFLGVAATGAAASRLPCSFVPRPTHSTHGDVARRRPCGNLTRMAGRARPIAACVTSYHGTLIAV